MDRNLALEFIRVSEAASIAASKWIGKGDKNGADGAAVKEMRDRFNQIAFSGTVVIGEGEKDKAPMLFTGEKVGLGGEEFDIAVDPLECTDSVAYGRPNALSVIVSGGKGTLLNAPDTYMEKIAVGPKAVNVVDLSNSVEDNIIKAAKALEKEVEDFTVVLLDRERHNELINKIRSTGARITLITDGDVSGAIAPSAPNNDIDMLLGIGASTEAVLAAAAIKILGGKIQARFKPKDQADIDNLAKYGITNLDKIYETNDLVKGDMVTFTATGVIDGPFLEGVKIRNGSIVTSSVVMRAKSSTVRWITTYHNINK